MVQVLIRGFRTPEARDNDDRSQSKIIGDHPATTPKEFKSLMKVATSDRKEWPCLGYYINDQPLESHDAAFLAVGGQIRDLGIIREYLDENGIPL